MSTTIKYKGDTITQINTTSSKTLKTSGKYCEADIVVENVQDGGITPTGTIDITENGTYDVTDKASAVVNIPDLLAMILNNQLRSIIFGNGITNIKANFLMGNTNLKYASFPYVTEIGNYNIYGNSNLKTFVLKTNIFNTMHCNGCHGIANIILNKTNAIMTLSGALTTNCTPIKNKTVKFWIPDNLLSSYQVATNWSNYTDMLYAFSSAEQYTAGTTYSIGKVCKYNGKFYSYRNVNSSTFSPSGTTETNEYWEYCGEV